MAQPNTKFLLEKIKKDKGKIFEKLEDSFRTLKEIGNPDRIVESQQAYESLSFIDSTLSAFFEEISDPYGKLKSYSGNRVFADLIDYVSQICDQLDFGKTRKMCPDFFAYENTDRNERLVFSLCHSLSIVNLYLPSSSDFRVYLTVTNGLSGLINLMKNDRFMANISQYSQTHLGFIIYNLNWISKSADSHKDSWNEVSSIPVLLKTANSFEQWGVFISMIIANVANDSDLSRYSEIDSSLDLLLNLAMNCINKCMNARIKQEFFDDAEKTKLEFEVAYTTLEDSDTTLSITGLLLAIYRYSICHKFKSIIYEKRGFMDALKKLIIEGNDVEKDFALKVIGQLCFSGDISVNIAKDEALIKQIKNISNQNKFDFKQLKKTADQLLWQIDLVKDKNSNSEPQKHFMISYNTGSRDLCLKIKSELQADNHKIWMDVDAIHGSSLDSMAKAVENSEIVLMCVSERYRESLFCQSEATYAYKLKKKIIPLIMQKGFESPSGWLGIIMGDKIFVDFCKYPYEEAIQRLKKQIRLLTNGA